MSRSAPASQGSVVLQTLAAGKLGVWPLVFTVLAAAAPLTVVGSGATTGWAVTAVTGIPVAYIAVAIALGLFAVGFVAMARRISHAGAFYTYVTRGLGRPFGVATAFMAVLAYNAMQIGLVGGFGYITAGFLDGHGITVPWWLIAGAGVVLVAVFGVSRIDLNGKVLATLLIAETVVALVLAIAQVTHPAGGTLTYTTLQPAGLLGDEAGTALAIAITGFVGIEGTAVFAEETKDPSRTVARATFIALAMICGLYAFCTWAISVATGPDQVVARATAEGPELTFNLAAPYVGAFIVTIGRLLLITSLFAAMLSFHNTAARYFYSLGREGILARWLGTTAPKSKAPRGGSLTQTGLAVIAVGCYAWFGWDPLTQMFFWLTVLGGFGVLLLMALTSTAVVAYFARLRTGDASGVTSSILTGVLAAVALGWISVQTVFDFNRLLGLAPDDPVARILPALYLAAAVAGLLWAGYLAARRPHVYRVIGDGAAAAIAPLTAVPHPAVPR
ncbi:APC family permease [Actinoplanes flavus]|uniref:APC family permease n=1 Tax=Actinoplanes flavus TaxID=2820290 RepID=A0ABS3UD33_9ACTN|nr:APC family permease [Actinoplanes flavus]MBO3736693.1 APC family permease [Actinoplanes flavus]